MSDFWFVYVLRSQYGEYRYVGSTNDVQRRLSEHNLGRVQSTKPYRPLELEAYIALKDEHRAREVEKYFKTGSGKTVLLRRLLSTKVK